MKLKRTVYLLSDTKCNGDPEVKYIYDEYKKRIHTVKKTDSIQSVFESCLNEGSESQNFKLLIDSCPPAKALWTDLEKTLKPELEPGQLVVFGEWTSSGKHYTLKSPIWIAGKIHGWKRSCDWREKNVHYHCIRNFKLIDGIDEKIADERTAQPAEKIEQLAKDHKILLGVKKQLKDAGLKNLAIVHMGKTYQI
jgi:hypothetical protein